MASDVTNQQIIDILFLIAPQFVTDDPVVLARYNSLIDALRCMFNPRLWCCCGALALANLLAHYLTIASTPTTGAVSSMSEGDLSISYAVTASENWYGLTAYGKAYWQMVGMIRSGPYVTNAGGRVPGTLAWGAFYGTPYGPCC